MVKVVITNLDNGVVVVKEGEYALCMCGNEERAETSLTGHVRFSKTVEHLAKGIRGVLESAADTAGGKNWMQYFLALEHEFLRTYFEIGKEKVPGCGDTVKGTNNDTIIISRNEG